MPELGVFFDLGGEMNDNFENERNQCFCCLVVILVVLSPQ